MRTTLEKLSLHLEPRGGHGVTRADCDRLAKRWHSGERATCKCIPGAPHCDDGIKLFEMMNLAYSLIGSDFDEYAVAGEKTRKRQEDYNLVEAAYLRHCLVRK